MDTRFWGPSGWKLLHLATFFYTPDKHDTYRDFFESIPYILPCKYCRHSLSDYYEKYPLDKALKSQESLIKWMYTIHNCVNDKLRGQSLAVQPNPTLSKVLTQYKTWINSSTPKERLATFWDFLFAVGYNHPKEGTKGDKPMDKCPPEAKHCADPCIRNKWNTMTIGQRMKWYKQFWNSLPAVLEPLAIEMEEATRKTDRDLSCRRSTMAWLWRLRCALDTDFKDPYTSVCRTVASYSSDCGSSGRRKTCRRRK
jgi:hypothetical protein